MLITGKNFCYGPTKEYLIYLDLKTNSYFVGLLCLAVRSLSLDMCHIANTLDFAEDRIVHNIIDKSETPLCDRNVIQGEGEWFKTKTNMVTNHTKQNACGTRNGIWLYGKYIYRLLSCFISLWNAKTYRVYCSTLQLIVSI